MAPREVDEQPRCCFGHLQPLVAWRYNRRALNTKLLIDALVHQTTVLIAQLSTAAGIRAPLAHIADQVFLELSREIEAQGVARKVVADMFGLAIRTYQKKVQRVTESVTVRDRTLWQAVLERLSDEGSSSRRELLRTFDHDDPIVVGSVLNDLVSSGLVYRTGAGDTAVFGLTKERDLSRALREQRREGLAPIVWVVVYRAGGLTRRELLDKLAVDEDALDEALESLCAHGQLRKSGDDADAHYDTDTFLVPVGAEHGWEAAVLDHFQAMARAIALKVRYGVAQSAVNDVVGGATLTFDVHPEHPHRAEVLALLGRVRSDVNALWDAVQKYNDAHPCPEESREEVSFYFGQSVLRSGDETP